MVMKKGFIRSFRKSKLFKGIILKMVLVFLFEIGYPSVSLALTSGPGQPEFTSFEPASTSDMVDLYSGSFTYNIPLLSVPGPNGGYPINIAYHSGAGMDEEASWVGLGWTLNVGAVNRQLQGIPDDIDGQTITYKMDQKNSVSVGLNVDFIPLPNPREYYGEIFGLNDQANPNPTPFSTQLYYNNYKGIGVRVSDLMLPVIKSGNKFQIGKAEFGNFQAQLGFSFDSQNGIGISPSLGFDAFWNVKFNASFNNRTGFNGFSYSMSNGLLSRMANKIGNRSKSVKYAEEIMTFWGSGVIDKVQQMNGGVVFKSATLSYNKFESLPSVTVPSANWYTPINMRLVGDVTAPAVWDTDFPNIWEGYFSIGKEKDGGQFTAPAYGYMYANKSNTENVNDYSKENIQYNKKTPYLAPSRNTFDVFMYTAQGSGGTFRPYHPEVIFYSDGKKESKSYTVGPTVEYSTGFSGTHSHFGVDVNFGYGTNTTGDWEEGKLGAEVTGAGAYMRVFGEQTGIYDSENYFDEWDKDEAVRFELGKTTGYLEAEYKLENELLFEEGNTASTNPSLSTQTAHRRSHMVKHLTNSEAQLFGVSRIEGSNCSVKTYDSASAAWSNKPYSGTHINNSHISEIQVIQPGGVKYIYGLPAYNKSHKEVSQSVPDAGDHNTELVNIADNDDYKNTDLKFMSETSYPAYAHSWLLTHVVSADYIDSDNVPGPSDGDIGYWVKFNYRKTHSNYKWRVPYEGANFIQGHPDDDNDNMATFSYGEKEIYYIHSIETKTHIAVFEVTVRKDAREAGSEYAQTSYTPVGAKLYKLDRIKLFSKQEYYTDCDRGTINTNAVPLQTVHFEYDYSLCPGIPNNNGNTSLVGNETSNAGGKLTLKKIWFTSENSDRGSLSPYVFSYTNNESYGVENVDRWGNFKENTDLYPGAADYPYKDFPYTEQERAINNNTYVPPVAQWALNQIQLPTGGVLNIEYEPNDYGYVEDQPAMRMFDIIGIGNKVENENIDELTPNSKNAWETYSGGSFTSSSTLPVRDASTATYSFLEHENFDNDGYTIFFELEEQVAAGTHETLCNQLIRERYVKGMERMYFKNFTVLKPDALGNLQKDYVSGYVELLTSELSTPDYFGMCKVPGAGANDPFTIGYVTVKRIPLQENNLGLVKCNEMTRFALQYLKLERPEIASSAMPQNNQPINQFLNLVSFGGTFLNDAMAMLISYNLWSFGKDYGKYIELNGKSIIRLYDPDERKYGNGARVKKLWIDDNWSNNTAASTADDANYGQEYFYTMDGTASGKSSGVAYEPRMGGEESSLREPVIYEHSSFMASTNTLFIEKPILESYYPGPSVGYRKVTVKSIAPGEAAADGKYINSTATPNTVYEFYTPKDFPVYGDETDLSSAKPLIRTVVVPGLYTDLRIKKARSQGYSIVTNDMAGKLKSTNSYTRNNNGTNGTLISSQEYIYNTVSDYDPNNANKLKNEVQVLVPDAADSDVQYRTASLGQTVDIFVERNENRSVDYTGGLQTNFEFGTLPYFFPEIYPELSKSEMSFKTVVVHKVIHRSGILKKIIAKNYQSTVQTENLAFDIETGEPLLTSVTNQFDEPIYSLSYPAHWYYKNLGPSYQNADLVIDNTSTITIDNNGYLSGTPITNSISKLTVGDQLFIQYNGVSNTINAHIILIDNTNNRVYCVQPDGNKLSNSPASTVDYIKIMNSGFKNQQTAKAGGVGFKKLIGFNNNYQSSAIALSFAKVLQANAVEYYDEWEARCVNCQGDHVTYEDNVNPFRYGFKGLWRLRKSYAYLTERLYNNNSKEDGVFADFTQFPWRNVASAVDQWISAGTITKYSPFGFELENKDPLGNFSAAQYGYNNSLPTAVAVNSRYNEMFFDGFEDYYENDCPLCYDDHFRWTTYSSIVSTTAHSGKYSMRVANGSPLDNTGGIITNPSQCDTFEVFSDEVGINGGTADAIFNPDLECGCIGKFTVTSGETYFLSTWVKHVITGSTTKPITYEGNVSIEIQASVNGTGWNTVTEIDQLSGKIIEGWQKLEGSFTAPSGGELYLKVILKNEYGSASYAYFDDLRVHPKDANMNSFVYDYRNFKILAELDENNYATFYVYDEAGNLVMKKKETAKGIMTLTEGRSDVPKSQ